jgi:CTP:molybdopterin cytidylyltransferase MocA
VVPTCGDRGGHPVWLPQARFAEVLANCLVNRRYARFEQSHLPLRVAVHDPEIMLDLDTPEALAQAELRLRR